MKIGFVLEHFYPHIGGGETMFKEYTSRLVELGCEVKVATSNSGGVTGRAVYEGVEVQHFPWRGFFGHPIPRPRDIDEVAAWADILHGAIFPAAPVTLHAARKFHKPCVVTVYEVWGNKWFWVEKNFLKAALFYAFEQFIIHRNYPLCHTISQATEKDLHQYGKKHQPVITIYPGLKSHLADYVPTTPPASVPQKTFLYYGRPGKTKGLFVLFEAIKRVATVLPDDCKFVFILANDPIQEKQKFIKLVAQHQLTNRVQICDPLPEMALLEAIQKAYCIIVPSITEGFGYTAAESCALGKPVISSDGGSLPEVVSGQALFFQNRNSADLARQILLAAEGRFEQIPSKVFDWAASTQKLLGVYEDLLKQHGKANAAVVTENA
ncbi:MAG: glycosyltransferase family 4 protein [Acidobacteria bacterium]|nr:glycosyltransferase family 4 protein [Acidobacteriota bacterium]